MGLGQKRIQFDGLLEDLDTLADAPYPLVQEILSLEESLIRLGVHRAASGEVRLLLRGQRNLNLGGNRARDLTLQRQHIGNGTLIFFGPQMSVIMGSDQ